MVLQTLSLVLHTTYLELFGSRRFLPKLHLHCYNVPLVAYLAAFFLAPFFFFAVWALRFAASCSMICDMSCPLMNLVMHSDQISGLA